MSKSFDKKKYLENPNKCPYCNSDDLNARSLEGGEHNQVWRDVECMECQKVWSEIFTMSDVEEVER